MKHLSKVFWLLGALLIVLSGCSPSVEASLNLRGTAEPQVDLAMTDLQNRLDLPDPSSIRVDSIEPVQLQKGNLGIPSTGSSGSEQTVQGYKITLSVPLAQDRREYVYHVANGQAVLVPGPSNKPVMGRPEFLTALNRQGLKVVSSAPQDRLSQPLFSAPDRPILVNGEVVHVYPYEQQGQAEAEQVRITENGVEVNGQVVELQGTPHFFRKDRLIVLYLGQNQTVLQALQDVLGTEVP